MAIVHFAIQMSNTKVIAWICTAIRRTRAVQNGKAECDHREQTQFQQIQITSYLTLPSEGVFPIVTSVKSVPLEGATS